VQVGCLRFLNRGQVIFLAMLFRLGALPFCLVGFGALGSVGYAAAATATAEVSHEDLGTMVKNLEVLVKQQQARIEDLRANTQQVPHGGRALLPYTSFAGGEWYMKLYGAERSVAEGLNYLWLLMCGILVFFVQAGFAMAGAGSCRLRNVQNVVLQNMTGTLIAAFSWWIFGWSLAYSGPWDTRNEKIFKSTRFGGYEQFVGHDFLKVDADGNQFASATDVRVHGAIARWFLEWGTCSFALAIAGAGVAERIGFAGHCIFSLLFTSFIYPLLLAATWGGGFLADMNDSGFQDFAGSGVIHMAGGTAALVGAIIAGARKDRWVNQTARDRIQDVPPDFRPHSVPLVVLGTFMMWFGWYGLNGARVSGLTSFYMDMEKGLLAAQVFMNSTLAAVTSGAMLFVLRMTIMKQADVTACCSGILAGLVSISAAAASVETGSACAIGAIGAILCWLASIGVRAAQIDDPMDAISIFFVCGWWGLLAETLFDWGRAFDNFHGANGFRCAKAGGACRTGMGAEVSGANWAEMAFICLWMGVLSSAVFMVLRVTKQLTPNTALQNEGYDNKWHDPPAGYDLEGNMAKTSL